LSPLFISAAVISHAVWLYFRSPLSLRMIEEMLLLSADRDDNFIQLPFVAGHRQTTTNSVGEFPAEFQRPSPDRFVTDVNASRRQKWLWWTVDQNGVGLDILIRGHRNKAAAKRLLRN
jgi:putative transposase